MRGIVGDRSNSAGRWIHLPSLCSLSSTLTLTLTFTLPVPYRAPKVVIEDCSNVFDNDNVNTSRLPLVFHSIQSSAVGATAST